MEDTLFGSFHNGAKRLGGIIMCVTPGKLFRTVIHPRVRRIFFANLLVDRVLIGHQLGIFLHQTFNQWAHLSGFTEIPVHFSSSLVIAIY
jgi:hypothetical protein